MFINKNKIIVIVGPTASGKSALAIKIAKKLNGQIISGDSRQVYKGMDTGTGKISKKEQKIIKHYLLDVVHPRKQFTASDFKRLGNRAMKEIIGKNKIPIIVGGSGFYIDILLNRMQVAEVKPDPKLRAKLEKQSTKQLFRSLLGLDPEKAKVIDRHNKRRLIRAIEISLATKDYHRSNKPKLAIDSYDILWLGINPGKKILAVNIKRRLETRLNQDMVREVRNLHKNGLSWKRLDDLGLEYRYISMYLKKEISKEKMKEYLESQIIKYSKRQMTWFKRNKEIHWIKNNQEANRLVKKFLYS